MVNREQVLKKISDLDDRMLVSKVLDKAAKAERAWGPVYSDFLDPHQKSVVEKAMSGMEEMDYSFEGGFSGAERMIVFFRPGFISRDDDDSPELPLKVLEVGLKGRDNLTHRDYLGALMALGIKREKIGDILVREDSCKIVVMSEIAEYISFNLAKVGSVKVEVAVKSIDELEAPEPRVKEISATVASLRLDCIASAGFGISRSKIADFIQGEKVSLNWEVTDSLTRQVKEGDTLSLRGRGRVVLESIGRTTKKGRIGVVLKKYI